MKTGLNKECKICGQSFYVRPSRATQIYCSSACRDKDKIRPQLFQGGHKSPTEGKESGKYKKCPVCGQAFYEYPSQNRKYCSLECRNKAYKLDPNRRLPKSETHREHLSEARKGKKFPYSKRPKVIQYCEFCGSPLDAARSSTGTNRGNTLRRFCNLECWYNYLREAPEHSPTFNGGAPPYYGPTWPSQRKLALKRDKFQCRICGISHKARRMDVHHIESITDENRDNWKALNNLSNLVTLCIKCHQKVHKGNFPCPAN